MITLQDLNFSYDKGNIDQLLSNLSTLITVDTHIIDIPELLGGATNDMITYLSNNFEINMETLAQKFEEYWNNQAQALRDEIEANLALDPNKLYDIEVTRAQTALNAIKFNNKTETELINYIVSNYIVNATVENSLKFDGYSRDAFVDYLRVALIPENAKNANTLAGMDYDTIKTDILNSVTSGSGQLDLVKDKVENEWISYKAADALKLQGKSLDEIMQDVINTKVNNAVNADGVNGYTYQDIVDSIDSISQNKVDAAIQSTNQTLIDIIKATKVLNSFKADEATNALKFNNKSEVDWKNIIIGTKVDNAVNADELGNLTAGEWSTMITDSVTSLTNDLLNGNIIPKKAQEPVSINGVSVADFDNHIRDIAAQVAGAGVTADDALKFASLTKEQWEQHIIQDLKVNYATEADISLDSNKLGGLTLDSVLQKGANEFAAKIISPTFTTDDNATFGQNILHKINENFSQRESYSTIDPSILSDGFYEIHISYVKDSTNTIDLISSEEFLNFDSKKIFEIQYTYNSSDLITQRKYILFNPDDITDFIEYTYNYSYDSNGNLINVINNTPIIPV